MTGSVLVSEGISTTEAFLRVPPVRRIARPYWTPDVALGEGDDGQPALLVGRPMELGGRGRVVAPTDGVLSEFLGLATVSEDRFSDSVLAFAGTWGPLDLCARGRFPGAWGHGCADPDYAPDERYPQWWTWEALAAWRRYSQELLAIIRAFGTLQRGGQLSDESWSRIKSFHPSPGSCIRLVPVKIRVTAGVPTSLSDRQRADVVAAIETWMAYGGVQVDIDWMPESRGLTWQVRSDGLPGMLAFDLMATLSERVYYCAGCGLPLVLKPGRRRPSDKTDQNVWCDRSTCGPYEKQRQYQRARYQRPEVRAERRQRYLAKKSEDSQTDSQPGGRIASDADQ